MQMLNVAMWEMCSVLCLYGTVPREGDAPFTPFLNPHPYSSSEGCYFCFTYLWNNLPCSKLILFLFTTITTIKCPQTFITQHFFLTAFCFNAYSFLSVYVVVLWFKYNPKCTTKNEKKKYIFEVLACFLEIQHWYSWSRMWFSFCYALTFTPILEKWICSGKYIKLWKMHNLWGTSPKRKKKIQEVFFMNE